jgi:hypothetical protein
MERKRDSNKKQQIHENRVAYVQIQTEDVPNTRNTFITDVTKRDISFVFTYPFIYREILICVMLDVENIYKTSY